jgi:nitrogen regulatory protein PII
VKLIKAIIRPSKFDEAPEGLVAEILNAIQKMARTGKIGDGKIFVCDVSEVIRIQTGERGEDAL